MPIFSETRRARQKQQNIFIYYIQYSTLLYIGTLETHKTYNLASEIIFKDNFTAR